MFCHIIIFFNEKEVESSRYKEKMNYQEMLLGY